MNLRERVGNTMTLIRSCYRDGEKNQFEMEILGETTDMGEPAFFVRLLPPYQDKFQEGSQITKLRKSLIGKDNLYKYVEKKQVYEQLTLF